MTSIAIYGDSFAHYYEAWPKILEFMNKGSKVKTYALGGTAADYSYSKFLETNNQHDVIIFLWTCVRRSTLIAKHKNEYKPYAGFMYNENLKICLNHNKVLLKNKDIFWGDVKTTEKWIKNEWETIKNFKTKNYLFHQAMRDSVLKRRPDAFIIECFDDFDKPGLINVYLEDRKQFSEKILLENTNLRRNHLSKIQNKEFANYMNKHINEKDFDIHDTFSDVKNYYTMSSSFEESGFLNEWYE